MGVTLLEAILLALGVREPGSTETGMESTPVTLIKTEAGNLFMIHISNRYVVHTKLTQPQDNSRFTGTRSQTLRWVA